MRLQIASFALFTACNSQPCEGHNILRTIVLDSMSADPPLQLRLESCRVDVHACPALCTDLAQRYQETRAQDCDVTYDGDAVQVELLAWSCVQ